MRRLRAGVDDPDAVLAGATRFAMVFMFRVVPCVAAGMRSRH
jgi:hypothetical protein